MLGTDGGLFPGGDGTGKRGGVAHRQGAALTGMRAWPAFKRFTIIFGVKAPSVLVSHEDRSLKDPLLLFVVRYPATMSCFAVFTLFVMSSWQR